MKLPWNKGQKASQEEIVIPEGRILLRVILLIVCVAITVLSLAYGLRTWLTAEGGVQKIIPVNDRQLSSCEDFTFVYDLGAGEASATVEKKALRALYTQAGREAYEIFSAECESDACKGLWYLNGHINEPVTVEKALYQALELVQQSGSRYAYLAPIQEGYDALFAWGDAREAAEMDPGENEALRAFYAAAAAFARDPGKIDLVLLGKDTVRLSVSEDYMAFARENDIHRWIDFGWMKNAFTADYLAESLAAAGYTRGTLISSDGFVRHLDEREGKEFTFLLPFSRGGVEELRFDRPVSLVYLHEYPVKPDGGQYWTAGDGRVITGYLDVADGLCRSAVPEMLAGSASRDCAQIALQVAPLFIADSLDASAAALLASREDIQIWYEEAANGE